MKFTTQYINDMLSCAKSKLAAAATIAWKRENFGLYGLADSLQHIYQLKLYIFLISRYTNSPVVTNATTEQHLSCMFDHIIRMPYSCILQTEQAPIVIVNRPPVVDAGPDQSLSSATTSTTLAGVVSDQDGDDFTVVWERIGGGNVTINSPTSVITTLTNMQPGTYNFRLTATDSKGLSAYDEVLVTIALTLDKIYYIMDDNPFPGVGQDTYIKAGRFLNLDSSQDVTIPYQLFMDHAQYCTVAIPNRVSASNKNHWYLDIINQGNMGTPSDLFGAPQTISVDGTDYLVWTTNYQTQFSKPCIFQKR